MVERDVAGIRLFDFLARSHADAHRGDLRQLLSSGEVSVNGEVCLHDRKLRLGDVVMLATRPVARRRGGKVRAIEPTVLCETSSVRPGMVVASGEERTGFRQAHTHVIVRERYSRHSLLELRPTTGRGHQIRVHLQSIGHPIVGDASYGGERLLLSRLKSDYKKRTGVEERPLLQRMFLHAERVAFSDVDGNQVVADAPMPEDLVVALRHVEKHRSPRRTQCD